MCVGPSVRPIQRAFVPIIQFSGIVKTDLCVCAQLKKQKTATRKFTFGPWSVTYSQESPVALQVPELCDVKTTDRVLTLYKNGSSHNDFSRHLVEKGVV